VIFGQKTLQQDASALDRINVRRLLLFLKSEVSAISRNLLFDQNIMYAKIFIKPTRAIEFIAVDFIITRSGASFED